MYDNTFTKVSHVRSKTDFIESLIGWHTDGVAVAQLSHLSTKSTVVTNMFLAAQRAKIGSAR